MSARAGLAALAIVAAAVAAPGAAGQEGHHDHPGPEVSIGYAAFDPASIKVLTGETVTWMNDSVRAHDVAADDGRFDSGRLGIGAMFTQRFTAPGTVTYFCRLHPSMRGEVAAWALLLDTPAAAVGPRRPFGLRGRTSLPAGTRVTLTARSEGGRGGQAVEAVVGEQGDFTAEVAPATTTTYVAVAEGEASPPVTLLVLDRRIAGAVRRGARTARVTATVRPAAPGATVVLQAHSREHFGWYPLRRARLDRASRVRFAVPLRRRLPLRVVLTLPDGATILASSGPLGEPARAARPSPSRAESSQDVAVR